MAGNILENPWGFKVLKVFGGGVGYRVV